MRKPGPIIQDRMARDDQGAATTLVVAVIGLLMFLTMALCTAGALVTAQRRAQAAADLVALAAASPGGGCAAGAAIAQANNARLIACAPQGVDVRVTVAVTGPRVLGSRREVRADARAGPR